MRLVQVFILTQTFALPAAAQPSGRLSLADVVAEALAKNPEIAVAQKRYEAARQRPAQERSLPDPMVSAGYNATGNPLPGAGLGTDPIANIGFMVRQELPYLGKLALRSSIASREADAEFQQIEATRLSVIARVKQAYYRLAYTHTVADVLRSNRALLDTLLKVSENRYSVGEAAQQDVIKAQTQISILELQLEPFELSLDALVAAAHTNAPMLKRDQIMIDRSRLAVDAARREYKPDFALSGGYYNMGSMPPMYEFRFDVKVPFQRARRAAALAEQLSTVEQARNAY